MYKGYHFTGIVLASGSGKRMKADVAKQFIHLHDKPMVYYSLKAFAESPVDSIVLVTTDGDVEYCLDEIVAKLKLPKVDKIVVGGDERYQSSINGVLASPANTDYVLIHDSARPCLTRELIISCMDGVIEYGNCTTAVKVVDTICQVNEENKIGGIPNRNYLWSVQTPQCFTYDDIKEAGQCLLKELPVMSDSQRSAITDDVWVVRKFLEKDVFVVEGSYDNIKVTNPADVKRAEEILVRGKEEEKRKRGRK